MQKRANTTSVPRSVPVDAAAAEAENAGKEGGHSVRARPRGTPTLRRALEAA